MDLLDFNNTKIVTPCMFIVCFILFGKIPLMNSVYCKSKPHWQESLLLDAQDICRLQVTTFIDPASPPTFDSDNGDFWLMAIIYISSFVGLFSAPRWYWSYVSSKTYHYYPEFCSTAKNYMTQDFEASLRRFDEAIYLDRNVFIPYGMEIFLWPYGIQVILPRCVQKFFDTHYLTICYLSFKFFQIINNIAIHFMVCFILTHDSLGVQSAFIVISGNNWKTTGLFPRAIICKFKLVIPSCDGTTFHLQEETTECWFSSNDFFERFFLIFFIASLCLFLANIVNFLKWLIRLCHSNDFLQTLVKHDSEIDFSLFQNKAALIIFSQTISFDSRFVLMMINFDAAEFSAKTLYTSFIQKNAIAKALLESPEKAIKIFENYLKNKI